MRWRIALLIVLSSSFWGQQSPDLPTRIANNLASDAEGLANAKKTDMEYSTVVQQSRFSGYIATLLMGDRAQQKDLDAKTYQTILTMMDHSTDTQVGSTPDTKGTTSLAMKGAVPKVLGFAVQHGAITEQVNGNTVTFRATPAGVLKALAGLDAKSIFGVATDSGGNPVAPSCDWCGKFSAAISFDVSQGSTPGTLTAAKQQVTSWSARTEVLNHRDAKRREYIHNFQRITGITEYTQRFNDLQAALDQSADFDPWKKKLIEQVQEQVEAPLKQALQDESAKSSPSPVVIQAAKAQAHDKFIQLVSAALVSGEKITLPNKVTSALLEYAKALKPLLQQRNDIIDYANKGLLLTADWTVNRDPNVPDLSTVTGILEDSFGPERKHDLTINVAAVFFDSTPKAPIHQFHDFKATAQYDIPLGTFQSYGPFVFSLASRYEFVPNDTLSPGGTITGTATAPMTAAPHGHLVVGQAKLTIPVKGTGVKIPFSISAANRTELIKEKDVRGNIGITFDLDAIFAQAGKNSNQ
jgi:hypothetical protein